MYFIQVLSNCCNIPWKCTFSPVIFSATAIEADETAVIFFMLHQLACKDPALFAYIIWSISKQRNN